MTDGRPALSVPIRDIGELEPAFYVGLIDETAIACLKVRLAAEGLATPIWVRKNGNAAKTPYSVIAGRHRLRAGTALGWSAIAVEVRAGPDSKADELRRLQLVENLDRRVLRPIERACFIMERWREASLSLPPSKPISQQESAARHRWSALATVANTPRTEALAIDEATAAITGDNPRTIRRYRTIYEKLVVTFPDHFALINAHPLAQSLSEMQKLAAVILDEHHDDRRIAVEALLDPANDWQSISKMLVALGIDDSTGKRFDRSDYRALMVTTFTKMLPEQKIEYLGALPELLDKDLARDLAIKLAIRWQF